MTPTTEAPLRRPADTPYNTSEKLPREQRLELALVRLCDAVAYENRSDLVVSQRVRMALVEACSVLDDKPYPVFDGPVQIDPVMGYTKTAVDRWVGKQ